MLGAMLETPTTTPAPPAAPPELRRRASHRLVAGVAGGLADSYRARPIWFRLVFLGCGIYTAAVLGGLLLDYDHSVDLGAFGFGLVPALLAFAGTGAYLLLWWLLPREDLPESAARRLTRSHPSAGRWPGLLLLGLGVAVLLAQLGVWRGEVVIAFALIGAGVLLYRREATPPVGALGATTSGGSAATASPIPDAVTLPVPLPPRERSVLGWMTIGVAMLVVGGALIWANLADATPRLVLYPALALLVLSAGLLVGTFVGRARWLVLPALALVPIVLLASVVRLPLEGKFGDLNLSPQSPGQVGGPYRVSVGGVTIDLTALEGQQGFVSLAASAVIGDVWIVVPYDAHVIAHGSTGYGSVSLLEAYDNGVEVSASATSEPRWGDGTTVDLDIEAGIGSVNVYRDYPTRHELRELKAERREAEAGG